jgi:hypothetical protein
MTSARPAHIDQPAGPDGPPIYGRPYAMTGLFSLPVLGLAPHPRGVATRAGKGASSGGFVWMSLDIGHRIVRRNREHGGFYEIMKPTWWTIG